jgi:hypothetical protein
MNIHSFNKNTFYSITRNARMIFDCCCIPFRPRECLNSPRFFGGIRVAPFIRFCAVLLQKCMCLSVPISVLWGPLQFPHKNDIRFVVTSSCLQKDSCLIYAFCVSLRIACPTHIVLYCALFIFISCLVYPMLPFSLDCPFLIAPSVFCNVYLK